MRLHMEVNAVADNGGTCDAKMIGTKARMVEAAGFNGVFNSVGSTSSGDATLSDPLTWLLMIAAATEHMEVGLACLKLPLQEPIDLAQRFMSLEALVPGRITVGVGSGSTPEGFDAFGYDYKDRFKILYSKMDKIRRLMNGETVELAKIAPWPEHVGGPHTMLAAWHSERSLKRAINEYEGWMTSCFHGSFNQLVEAIKIYRDLGGKRAMAATCRIDLTAKAEKIPDDEAYLIYCGPEEAAERINRVAELGYDDLGLHFYRAGKKASPTAEDLEQIRALLPKDNSKPYDN